MINSKAKRERTTVRLRDLTLSSAKDFFKILAAKLGFESSLERKVFCVGMQRTGTTSFGDFCETQLGLSRRGYSISHKRGWTRAWYNGHLDDVFRDPYFRTGEVFDDDPWWCPGVASIVLNRFPQAKLVMFRREPEAWFRSLLSHSHGKSPGYTDIHARIYGREAEFTALLTNGVDIPLTNGFDLEGQREFYMEKLEEHQNWIASLASKQPDRVLVLKLDDPDKFRKIAVFLEFEDRPYTDVRSNVIASLADNNR
ncbi:MAG: hypothetical protein KDJ62_12315 [Rhodobiaceae bacterium]|nr:hypothetical protein [Rhodobiaceae bacterium]